jgi:cyclic 2,3-diphosphoglycerate synthetase
LRVLVLIDGEHHPSVIRWGIGIAKERGLDPIAAVLVGGSEKLGPDPSPDIGVEVWFESDDLQGGIARAIAHFSPEGLLDLADEPALGYEERATVISQALFHRIAYIGPGTRLDPPALADPLPVPSVAVIGTGKRTGKTAVAGDIARRASGLGLRPVLVAMGRGGPAEPTVAEAGSVDLAHLVALVRNGQHAASDYLEDAVTTGVTTVGARRIGGGPAGIPWATNAPEAARVAAGLGSPVILEGSGAAIPPVPWDSGVLVVPVVTPVEYLSGYLGPYRLLLTDLVVFTMGAGPVGGAENLSLLRSHVRRVNPDARHIVAGFVPVPLQDVRGREAFFATTAPGTAAEGQIAQLEAVHGCHIVAWSNRLADRAGLSEDMEGAGDYDVLLTELKAAAVEVACAGAARRGAEVVFVDNRPVAVEGGSDLAAELEGVIRLAMEKRR